MEIKRQLPRAIIFFGPDGAGKSTQARLLIAYLRSRRRRTWWTWIRGRHSLAFLLANLFTKLGYYNTVRSGEVSHKVFNPHLMPKLKRVWIFIEFVSILPWIITRMYFPIILGYTIVAERYVIDTLAYMGYWIFPNILQTSIAKILLCFIPRNSVLFYINAETKVLMERIKDDTVTYDFVLFQQEIYGVLAKTLHAIIIDTSKHDVEKTFQRILEALN